MARAQRTVLRRWLAWLRRRLAGVGRALMADMCVLGVWTGSMVFDAYLFKALTGWACEQGTRQSPDCPDPEAGLGLPPAVSAPPLERLIPEIPLSPRERELWADLLDEGRKGWPGRNRRRFRLLRARL